MFYCADNGASGEGSPNGSVNENKFFNGYPDELTENLKYLDVLGGPDTYNHYPTGWAVALLDAVPDVQAVLELRRRHLRPAGDLVAEGHQGEGRDSPSVPPLHRHRRRRFWMSAAWSCRRPIRGVEQYPLSGVSMRYSFDAKPEAPTQKKRQYYTMLGTRGLWEDGWKAVAVHAPLTGKGNFDKDPWQLYHVDVDRAEAKDLAKDQPGETPSADQGLVRGSGEEQRPAAGRPQCRSNC